MLINDVSFWGMKSRVPTGLISANRHMAMLVFLVFGLCGACHMPLAGSVAGSFWILLDSPVLPRLRLGFCFVFCALLMLLLLHSSIPQWLGSAPAPPPSPWAWCRNFNLCYKHATAATSAPNRPRSRAPWGGTPGQGGHGLHLALVLLLELQCFGLGCCLLGEVAAFDVPFLWGNLHIPLLHTFAFSCPTSPSALRWWSWGPGASARWGCPSPPALHGRPWRPRELLRRPGPRRLKRQDYRGPPTPGHSEHHFASPGCFSWTALVSAPHNVVGDAQRQQLQLGLLGPFQSVGWHHCQTCLRCLYLKGPETGNSLSLSRPLCARCHKVYIILY